MTARAHAKQRYNDFHGILFSSDLTMVHDTIGECSPNVTEAINEKKKLAKTMAIQCLDREMESLKSHGLSTLLHGRKIKRLAKERIEIENL